MPIYADGRFRMHGTEEKFFNLIKCRSKRHCRCCGQNISPKSYCLGSGYPKICLKCYEGFLIKAMVSFKGYYDKTENLLNEINTKKNMLVKNNVLAKVEDNETE